MSKHKSAESVDVDIADFVFWNVMIIVALVWFAFLVTNFSFKFNTEEIFAGIYMRTLDRLKHWQWDLEPEVLQYEGYLRDGKYYPYFGPFPALFRGALEIIFGRRFHDWARVSCLVAAILTFVFCQITVWTSLARKSVTGLTPAKRRWVTAAFGLILLCSSSIALALNVAYVYNEAIIWSLAWTTAYIMIYTTRPNIDGGVTAGRFAILSACTACALLSRFSIGGGALAHLSILAARAISNFKSKNADRHTSEQKQVTDKANVAAHSHVAGLATKTAAAIAYAAAWILPLLVNYERWGSPFIFLPLTWNTVMRGTPAQSVVENFGLMNIKRLPLCFEYYWLPHATNFSAHLPWVDFAREFYFGRLAGLFVYVEPTQVPLLISSFGLVVAFVLGIAAVVKRKTSPGDTTLLLCMAMPAAMIFVFVAVAQRYAADLFPVLFTAALMSVNLFAGLQSSKWRRLSLTMIFVVALSVILGLNTIVRDKLQTSTLSPAEVTQVKTWLGRLEHPF